MTPIRPAATVVALLAGLSLSVGVAACGGGQIAADEVAAPPPELTIPTEGNEKGADALAGDTPSSDTGTTSTNGNDNDNDNDTSTTPDTSTDSRGGTSGNTGGAPAAPQATAAPSNPGGTQAPAQQDDSANDTAPQPGSGAEKFEEFCKQNAGAC